MKHQALFSLKNYEKVFMNVVCCSRDWRLQGEEVKIKMGTHPCFSPFYEEEQFCICINGRRSPSIHRGLLLKIICQENFKHFNF